MLPAAILCGGLAVRLRPITDKIPKALIEVNGEPFLAHQLRLLASRGLRKVALCVGYLGNMIQDFVGDGTQFGLHAEICFDGPQLLGTAGAIRRAIPILGEEFFVLYGDSYLPCDYGEVAKAFQRGGKLGLMTVFQNDSRWDASNVEFAAGRILKYDKEHRTPAMRHIDYGLGVFHRDAFTNVPPQKSYDLAAVYRTLLDAGQLDGFEMPERFFEIGSPEGLRETAEYLRTSRPTA